MRSRYRKIIGAGIAGTIIVLPPPGDEALGLALGAAISGGKHAMDDTSSNYREKRRGGGGANPNTARWVGIIVIGAIVILAAQVGGLRSFVQH